MKILVIIFAVCLMLFGVWLIYRHKNQHKQQQTKENNVKKYFDESYKKQQSSYQDKLAEGIANGTVKIIDAKYPINENLFNFFIIGMVVVFIGGVWFYLNEQAKTCQEILGFSIYLLNKFWVDILCLTVFSYILINLAVKYFQFKIYKENFYPPLDKQPLFLKRTCQLIDDNSFKQYCKGKLNFIFLYALLTASSIIDIPKDVFPLAQANQNYQQQCLAENRAL